MYSQNSDFSQNNLRQNFSYNQNVPYGYQNTSDGFAFPFLLGGVTGAALAPSFWRPNYPNYYYPPRPPYYGPYYRPYRPY